MEDILTIVSIVFAFFLYLAISILCDRYFGFNLNFIMTHRALEKHKWEKHNQKNKVDKFIHENPDIHKIVLENIKKKRWALTYNNIDISISKYINKNPDWADADYKKQLVEYEKKLEIHKKESSLQKEKQKQEIFNHFYNESYTKEEIQAFIDKEILSFSDYGMCPLFAPKKKTY